MIMHLKTVWIIDTQKQVFNLFKTIPNLSHSHDLSATFGRIFNNTYIFGYASMSQTFNTFATKSGRFFQEQLSIVFATLSILPQQTQDVNRTYIRRLGRLLKVLCTFTLRPVSVGKGISGTGWIISVFVSNILALIISFHFPHSNH